MSEPLSTDPRPVEALIVVDMQRGFLAGDAAVAEAGRLTRNVSDLLRRAREAQALVIHLKNDGSAGAIDEPGRPGDELEVAPSSATVSFVAPPARSTRRQQ
jgi:nicotinamidase-related amidase